MIKVLVFNSDESLKENEFDIYDEDYERNRSYNYFDFPSLNKFLREGWIIKDWKMKSDHNDIYWTFILEDNY